MKLKNEKKTDRHIYIQKYKVDLLLKNETMKLKKKLNENSKTKEKGQFHEMHLNLIQ